MKIEGAQAIMQQQELLEKLSAFQEIYRRFELASQSSTFEGVSENSYVKIVLLGSGKIHGVFFDEECKHLNSDETANHVKMAFERAQGNIDEYRNKLLEDASLEFGLPKEVLLNPSLVSGR